MWQTLRTLERFLTLDGATLLGAMRNQKLRAATNVRPTIGLFTCFDLLPQA